MFPKFTHPAKTGIVFIELVDVMQKNDSNLVGKQVPLLHIQQILMKTNKFWLNFSDANFKFRIGGHLSEHMQ